ncbi:MAG: hypothetical protein QF864_12795 [SAR202 cluster bacterium]|nr:hypothetical protein [SAR202 cluster bacterium]
MDYKCKINYFDYKVDNLSMYESLAKINNSICANNNIQHVVSNVAKFVKSRQDTRLHE